MYVRVRGVKRVRAKGGRVYFYHRKTRRRIKAVPDTAAFAAEVAELDRLAAPPKRDRKQDGSWGALVAAYRKSPEYALLKPRTRSDYEKVFGYLDTLDRMPVVQFDAAFVLALRDKAFDQRKRRFANHVVQVVGTALNWGKPRKLSLGYPLSGEKRVKIPRPKDAPEANRAWSPDEQAAVLAAATGGVKLAVALGMFAAMRDGDVAWVPWSIYDGAMLRWRQGKTGDAVELPAAAELRALLDAAPRLATTIVTGAKGRPLTEAGVRKAFRQIVKRLERDGRVGLGLTFHGLRTTAATTLADLGADIEMIKSLLGQRSASMALHYSRDADRKRAGAAAVHLLEEHRAGTKLARASGKLLEKRTQQER